MRRRLLLTVCAALATATVAVAASGAPSSPGPVFVLTGGGWGHGVGMSQWGALGQAREGRTFEQILATYYPGTELATAPAAKVRVLLVPKAKAVTVTSAAAFRVRAADGVVVDVPPGTLELDKRLLVALDGVPTPLTGPLRLLPGPGSPLVLGDRPYRGELRVSVTRDAVQVLNVVGLEAYLLGVVPGEVPDEWPAEALRAQAVAARTYAVSRLAPGKPYDVYADVRSQVYGGVAVEAATTTRAVKDTRGTILTYEGKPAEALYFSSSGGRTLSAIDVFGTDFPYLVSVDDPWDAVVGNPNHRWEPRTLTGAQLAKALKLLSPIVDVTVTPGVAGRPATVRFTTRAGTFFEQRLSDLRYRLGLKSTGFRIGVLRLSRPELPAATGTRVSLTGIARDVEQPQLEKRRDDGSWARAARVRPRDDGSFTVVVRPPETTTYRLTAAGLPGPSLTLTVAEAPE